MQTDGTLQYSLQFTTQRRVNYRTFWSRSRCFGMDMPRRELAKLMHELNVVLSGPDPPNASYSSSDQPLESFRNRLQRSGVDQYRQRMGSIQLHNHHQRRRELRDVIFLLRRLIDDEARRQGVVWNTTSTQDVLHPVTRPRRPKIRPSKLFARFRDTARSGYEFSKRSATYFSHNIGLIIRRTKRLITTQIPAAVRRSRAQWPSRSQCIHLIAFAFALKLITNVPSSYPPCEYNA